MSTRLWSVLNLLGLLCGFVGGILLFRSLTLEPSEFRLVPTSNGDMALCRKDKLVSGGWGGKLSVTNDPCPEWEHTGPTVEVKANRPAYVPWGLAFISLGFLFQLPVAIATVAQDNRAHVKKISQRLWPRLRMANIPETDRDIFARFGETVIGLVLSNGLTPRAAELTKIYVEQPIQQYARDWLTECRDLHARYERRMEIVEWGVFAFVVLGVIIDFRLLFQ